MVNKSLFLKAAEQSPDAVQRISELAIKIADLMHIYNRAPVKDPLDDPNYGPARLGNNVDRGKHIGQLAGTLGGAALGGLAGYEAGSHMLGGLNEAGQYAGHTMMGHTQFNPNHDGWDPNNHEPLTQLKSDYSIDHDTMFHHLGGDVGAVAGAGVGAAAGHLAGKPIGAGIARLQTQFAAPEVQAAERIRRMDPASGLAHIRMMEQSGRASPSVIQAMKDTYNTRRTGLQTQLQSGVALPPGEHAREIGTQPKQLPV